MDSILADVDQAFKDAEALAREFAKEKGINLEAELTDYDHEEEQKRDKKLRRHPFYVAAEIFYNQAHVFLSDIEEKMLITPEIKEYLDDIIWYHTLIPAKTYRALSISDYSDAIETDDSLDNTELIVKVVCKCRSSLDRLCFYRPKARAQIQPLLEALDILEGSAKKFLEGLKK